MITCRVGGSRIHPLLLPFLGVSTIPECPVKDQLGRQFSNAHNMIDFPTSFLIPKPCPFELIRIGGSGDGAYLIPNDLDGIDACFSPGVNNFKDFEDAIANDYGIKCHMCDFTSDPSRFRTPLIQGMQTFKKKWLDIDGCESSISLGEWIGEFSPCPKKDLILQIDIEGAEYRNLLAAGDDLISRFRIIVVELHGLGAFKDAKPLSKSITLLLERLDRTHLCVHVHPNNCCGDFIDNKTGLNIPNVIEVTYLRRDRFRGDQSEYINPQLPHPEDISRNVRKKPPIHLNEMWLSPENRSVESQMKVLQDNLDFFSWENDQLRKLESSEAEEAEKIHRVSISNLARMLSPHALLIDSGMIDIALGKRYFISKSYGSYPAEGIVMEADKFFFHTAMCRDQSITIDFGKPYKLQALIISNRKDACQDRARKIYYILHDARTYSVDGALPVVISDQFLEPNGPESVTPLFGKEARYLTIFSPIYTALHFSRISVY